MLCSLPRSCVVHPIDRLEFRQWRVVQLWPGDILNMFCVILVKKHEAFKGKDPISSFPVSPGSAEALVRWGGKIKYVLITYFLGNIFAKNWCNRTANVKIIASQRWDVFWDTVYVTHSVCDSTICLTPETKSQNRFLCGLIRRTSIPGYCIFRGIKLQKVSICPCFYPSQITLQKGRDWTFSSQTRITLKLVCLQKYIADSN